MLKDNPLKKPFWMFNKHIETIASIFFLKNLNLKMNTQRLFTPDYDFIDIDFVINDPQKNNSIITARRRKAASILLIQLSDPIGSKP